MMDFKQPSRGEPDYIPRANPAPQQAPHSQPSAHQPTPPVHHQPKPAKRPRSHGRKGLIGAVVILVVGLAISGYFYQHNKASTKTNNAAAAAESEVNQIVNQISRTVQLPTNETPQLTTLQNVSSQTSPAYKDAKDGDKVLVYSTAGKAVIYRPSTKKVIIYTFFNANATSNQQ